MRNRLALALSFFIAAQPAAGATQAVVLRNRVWTAAAPNDCKPIERGWIWSEATAPEPIDGTAWCTDKPLKTATQRLALQVVPRDRRAALSVIAAPAAMWADVPEALLPRFAVKEPHTLRVPHDGRSAWRVRAVGELEGTGWIDVPATQRTALLGSAPAATRLLQLLAADGKPAAGATVEILRQHANARPVVAACFTSDARGRVSLPAVPDLAPLHFVTHHAAHAVDAFSASTAEFPLMRQLEAGTRLRGRFLSNDEPVPGVALHVEAWVAGDLPHLFHAKASAAADGTFVIEHLPRRTIALAAVKGGFLPHRATLDLNEENVDLGSIALERGGTLSLLVVNDAGQPVADAKLDAGSGRVAKSDAKGKALLRDVPPNRPIRITVTGDGHLRESVELQPPFEGAKVRLPRGFVVQGRIADPDGVPVPSASIRVENGPSYRVDEARDDGTFTVTLKPEEDAKLVMSSPSTSELAVPIAAGAAGEVRDLGTLTAPRGMTIAGRIISADGTPVAGARIWSPKQSAQGPLVAFMNNELVEASSAADGTFQVTGLKAAPLVLRVDAPGFARVFRTVQLDGSVPSVALGDVVVSTGATLRVETRASDAVARVDTRGESLDIDLLTAAVRDGIATVPHVAAGSATLTIVRNHRTLCEKRIVINGEDEVRVECHPLQTAVRGSVLVGASPARGGTLTWTPSAQAGAAAAIMERTSPNGLRQQQAWGASDAPVTAILDDAGRFETDELRPGRWNVAYGGTSQQVEIPEHETFELALRFTDTALSGVIVDRDGVPVPRAVVEVTTANASMLAREDGSFDLRGLVAGEHEIRARAFDGRVATGRVRIEEGRDTPPLRLVLEAERPAEVRIAVTRGGQPAPGAFVFVELENEGQRILTADARGVATLRVSDQSGAKRLRLAGYDGGMWAFDSWRSREQSALALAIDRVGDLAISGASGSVEIVRADGWNVSQLLRRIGAPPQADRTTPLVLSGLAPGSYMVAVGSRTLHAEVSAGRSRVLDFE
ncbi:MAG TPA: carboxypeptidase-like regulatory domain-containing protein [Thermoanaerobaculia bacterium]|nr:carboxypeptidase-like regulatory domain-containing protein [Thermoanaerobaculia bacterium]